MISAAKIKTFPETSKLSMEKRKKHLPLHPEKRISGRCLKSIVSWEPDGWLLPLPFLVGILSEAVVGLART